MQRANAFLTLVAALLLEATFAGVCQSAPAPSAVQKDAAGAKDSNKKQMKEYYRRQAEAFERQLEYEKEAEAVTKAMEYDPNDVRLIEKRADAWEHLFMLDRALPEIKRIIQMEPQNAGYYRHLGRIYRKMQKDKLAAEAYTKAIALDPKDAAPFRERGRIYISLGDDKKAIADLEHFSMMSKNDHNGEILHLLGELCLKTGDYKKALKVYNREIELVPDLPGGYHGRARTYVRMGRKDLAEKDEKTAWEIEKHY